MMNKIDKLTVRGLLALSIAVFAIGFIAGVIQNNFI